MTRMGWSESQRFHLNQLLLSSINPNRIPQRPAEADECDRHHVAVLKLQLVLEAEPVRSEEMHVRIAGMPVLLVLEMMMLQVPQRVRHVRLPARQRPGPDGSTVPFDAR